MVRVSWPDESTTDKSVPFFGEDSEPSAGTNDDKSKQNHPCTPTATSSPSSSNTPTSVTSPSSHSPALTSSPAPTVTPSTPTDSSSAIVYKSSRSGSLEQSLFRKSLIEEFKGDFWALKSVPTEESTEMVPLDDIEPSTSKEKNNNRSKLTLKLSDQRLSTNLPNIAGRDDTDQLIIKEPLTSSLKRMKEPISKTFVCTSPMGEDIYSKMIATCSEFEDDIEPIDSVDTESEPEETQQIKELLTDRWRQLFDKFDFEGFGEIPWPDFRRVLVHPEFVAAVDDSRREQLAAKAQRADTTAITFQDFVNIMSGKRTRSFKCAMHHRDKEVTSENDFKLLLSKPPLFTRMVKVIADEFLTEERDRKYYADYYTCWPPPVFILAVTLLQLSVFCYYTVISGEMEWGGPVPLDSPFIYRPDQRQHVWRFLFYALLHAGWVHLAFNLMVQLLVGLPLEMVHGSARIGTVYIAGVLAGSLGTSVFDSKVFLVGASGGVYALLAAHLANVLINYHSMQFGILRLIGVLFVASADVGYAIYDRYAHVSIGLPVSYVAHLTGALAGLTLGLVVLKNFEQRLHEQLLWWVALGVYIACTIFAVLFNVFHPYPYEGVAENLFL